MDEHILFSYGFDGKGGGKVLVGDEISQLIKDDRLAWVHLDSNHHDTREWLEREVSYLDNYILEALLAEETRPRMTKINDGLLLILRGVNLNENSDPEDMVSIRLWVDAHRIISIKRRNLKAIGDIEEKIKNGNGPKDSGDFVTMLTDCLFVRLEPFISEIDDATDDIEEKILETANTSLRESIIEVRKKAIMFRRYMAPQCDAISQLSVTDISWIKDIHRRHLQEVYNHVMRYIETLDAIRERAQIVKDELANMIGDKLNRNMYFLSVIAAIFLPLTFLTGLLGVNVGGIPGANNSAAFWVFCGILSIVVLLQIFFFKKSKLF